MRGSASGFALVRTDHQVGDRRHVKGHVS
jgi:hypothetical protein